MPASPDTHTTALRAGAPRQQPPTWTNKSGGRVFRSRSSRGCRRVVTFAASVTLAVGVLTPLPASAERPAPNHAARILPVPQQIDSRPSFVSVPKNIDVVAGEAADPAARTALVELLSAHGVTARIVGDSDLTTRSPMIILGGPGETPASTNALRDLKVTGPESLPREGYVLAAGRDQRGRERIVLSGVDGAGTFYAVQSLRQLLVAKGSHLAVDGVQIRDWPGYQVRGGMESFYGPVWSQEDRRSQIEFLARHKMNQFFYGPADDLRTGSDWASLYEAAELARLKEIVDLSKARHVDFVYRISPEAPMAPSKGICHVRETDRAKLLARFEQMWEIGVRSYVVAWDDVSGNFACQEDRDAYRGDRSPLAVAQAEVTNFVQKEFIEKHPGANRMVAVPTEYWGMTKTPYTERFDELLSTEVDLYWTGPAVVSPSITEADLQAAQDVWSRHRIMLWDNYPVNDYSTNRLLLGPLKNRDASMADKTIGISFNELVGFQDASQIALGTQADYSWNPVAYDAERSWTHTLQILGGDAYEELRLFAENNRASVLDATTRPEFAALINRLMADYRAGRPVTAQLDRVDRELRHLEELPAALRAKLDNPVLLKQIAPWLDRVGVTGQAGRAALRVLKAQDTGASEAGWVARRDQASARLILDRTWHQISPGPVDELLSFAAAQSDAYIGDRWYGDLGTPTGTPAAASGSRLANLTDRRDDTVYVAASVPQAGDAVTVPITKPHPLSGVTVVQDATAPADGMIQALVDGTWVNLGQLADGFTKVPAKDLAATAVRIQWTPGSVAPRVYEIVPHYSDVLRGRVSLEPSGGIIAPGTTKRFQVALEVFDEGRVTARVAASGPAGWTVTPATQVLNARPDGRTIVASVPVAVTVPSGTTEGRHQVTVTFYKDGVAPVTLPLTIIVGEGSYPEFVNRANPSGYWRLGDAAGSRTAVDSSTSGQNGIYQGAEPGAGGVLAGNGAADLSNGYIDVPRSPRTNLTGPFTVEAWVKLDTLVPSPGQAIIESYTGPAHSGYALRASSGVLQAWSLGSPGKGHGVVSGRTQLTPNKWHHVAAVFDGSRLTVYLDGVADNSVATTVAPGSGTASVKLGGRGDDTSQRLQGDLDEAAIYDRALTANEIQEHYFAGIG
ncbi:beta-N-acetylglucosaminidase domain-containing protein [Micromonospora peucetia]|uniref:Beta-N-acetylglucosaminidase domain-containing protein n=1 Tax=Micromonospora peucetia TaxID=47871 RepID=A0ABZ1E8G7_9ACTN|nr:beta-N-acetylglucosaminidase domain-containing protein [Micromonospora peucetia]WSA31086.1 beta-N-acetylglucosaminidase domain-containing protein [Micromonospora peucetia]